MATTAIPNRPRRRSQQPRVSVRVPEVAGGHENEYDLLTAALIGATIGAGLTFLLRRGPSGRRPMMPLVETVGRGAGWAGRHATRLGGVGARWAAQRGEAMWDRIPRNEIREHVDEYRENVGEYMGRAREAIDDAVASELDDLRRAVRRQRKRLGI
jgi:hypothetical protein